MIVQNDASLVVAAYILVAVSSKTLQYCCDKVMERIFCTMVYLELIVTKMIISLISIVFV